MDSFTAVIDLTETPSPPRLTPAIPDYLTIAAGRAPAREPPVLQDGAAAAKRRRIKQALPFVSRAVEALPERNYKVEDLAVHALAALTGDSGYDAAVPFKDDQAAEARAEAIVRNLASQRRYQRTPPPPVIPPVDRPKSVETDPLPSAPTETPSAPQSTLASSRPQKTQSPPRPRAVAARHPALSRSKNEHARHTSPFQRAPSGEKRDSRRPPARLNSWFNTERRPYQPARERRRIAEGMQRFDPALKDRFTRPTVFHVDFTQREIASMIRCVSLHTPATIESLINLAQNFDVSQSVGDKLPNRTVDDVRNFCTDLRLREATHPDRGCTLTLQPNTDDFTRNETRRMSKVASMLLARELEGNRGFGQMRQYVNFQNEFRNAHEDGLTLIAEFTNCAGDISTATWVPEHNIICGTTNHSDRHNQQYNKPGNLLLCSVPKGELRAFPDHRIPRPLVEKGDNSTEAMRRSQDPWLYSSVVSSDYDSTHNLAFTSSFDRTVKVWRVDPDGGSMQAVATWHLEGNVNFVCAAKDGSGRVATAADVPSQAVRIYTVNQQDIANSPYVSFSCSRTDADGSDKWAYFPATMQWGRAPGSQHILAVGYSPRSFSGSDHDIPEEKQRTGEVTLWDANRDCRLHVTTATTSNFFEIVWHPTLPHFIAATTPSGLNVNRRVRTQIHLFRPDLDNRDGGYSEYQNLDCYASDINELTFISNSRQHAYVTAGCTDGNVYVWDTVQGDKPIHILEHGHPVDEFHEDREKEDTGVKFTAWGITLDRFYTGSSDGLVKVWNVRKRRSPFVRNLLVAPGPISCGAFSPDASKLVVGDATGRVFVFSINKSDAAEAHYVTLPGTGKRVRRPLPFINHAEPPPPPEQPQEQEQQAILPHADAMDIDDPQNNAPPSASEADEARRTYLDTGKLVLHPDPTIGAVQGPSYAATNLFRPDAHLNGDPSAPLLPTYERQQRINAVSSAGAWARSVRRLKDATTLLAHARFDARHEGNKALDFDASRLDEDVLAELMRAGATLSADEDWGFVYEEMPAEI